MNIINCSPFNNCGVTPDCGCGCGCRCGCGCGCGCSNSCGCSNNCGCSNGCGCNCAVPYTLDTTGTANYSVSYSCYKNNCAAGYGCGCAYPWIASGGFIPTPEEPFPCSAACSAQGRQVDYSGYTGGFSHVIYENEGRCARRGCGCGNTATDGCGCGCSGTAASSCEDAVALLQNSCCGLGSIKAEIDQVHNLTGAIYEMMAPVPIPCACACAR